MTALATLPPPPFTPTQAERRTLAVRPSLSMLEWSERHVHVTEGPLASGAAVPWSSETFPLQRTIVQAIDDPMWSETVLLTPPQAFGKTQCAALPTILYALGYRRVSVAYVSARSELGFTQWRKKIEPAMKADPLLSALIYANPDFGGTKDQRMFTNGTGLHVVGSESIAALSGYTVPVVICDDVHAYPENLPRFGHPADYAQSRAGAYPSDARTLVFIGTASTVDAWLWRSMLASAFFVPFVPCLACGAYQLLEFERLAGDHSTPENAIATTYLPCVACSAEMTFEQLPEMLSRHLWISMPPDVNWITDPLPDGVVVDPAHAAVYPNTDRNTNVAGFWANAMYWPLGLTWGERVAEWLGDRTDPVKAKTHQQNIRVRPYREPKADEDAFEPADVYAHAVGDHKFGSVPADAGVQNGEGVIVLTTDVQAGHVWYLACVWRLSDGSCWLIECGRIGQVKPSKMGTRKARQREWAGRVTQALEKLWEKESAGWPIVDLNGEDFGIGRARCCFVDCGFLRDTVQVHCKLRNGGRWDGKWRPVEGSNTRAMSKVPIWNPIMSRERRTGRYYHESNTNRAKLYLRDIMSIPPGKPGSLMLPGDMPEWLRDQFAKHLCAEEWQSDKGSWKQVSGENHLLDAMALQLAGALACGVRLGCVGSEKTTVTFTDKPRRKWKDRVVDRRKVQRVR